MTSPYVAVQLSHVGVGEPGTVVEAVHILGHHSGEAARLFEADDRLMTPVGLHPGTGTPQLPVEMHSPASDPQLVTLPVAVDGEVVGVHLGPQSVRPPEVGDPRFGAQTRSAEYQDAFGGSQHLGGGGELVVHDPVSSSVSILVQEPRAVVDPSRLEAHEPQGASRP